MIEYRIRKDDYISKWYAEKLEWGMVVRRYDYPSEKEATDAIKEWKKYN